MSFLWYAVVSPVVELLPILAERVRPRSRTHTHRSPPPPTAPGRRNTPGVTKDYPTKATRPDLHRLQIPNFPHILPTDTMSNESTRPSSLSPTNLVTPSSSLQGRHARSGSNILGASYSTPDLCLSPSGVSLLQSTSVPSLVDTLTASDLTSASYTSIPVSDSARSISGNASHPANDAWSLGEKYWSTGQSPILPSPPSTSSYRRRKGMLTTFLHPISRLLPASLWDRIIFLIFCVYVAVLFRALLGLGGTPVSDSCTVMQNMSSVSQPQATGVTVAVEPEEMEVKVVVPAELFMPAKQYNYHADSSTGQLGRGGKGTAGDYSRWGLEQSSQAQPGLGGSDSAMEPTTNSD
ncbi:hypothetical protein BXZ70DRAFT_1005098 [Cristinia sonorae]|uniref:Uncharacterized protein n=1 Tax=Cristinia sonorae TaxID=1940300 RepID=A0A8K0UVI4_9AGAR|nr:hypothetical protein BXZ70DRAFT_1005098 [Cristinia sonorae]